MSQALTIEKFTSSEGGSWSNAYLVSGPKEALLFDVFMLRPDTEDLVSKIKATGKTLTHLFISHAHPDHFMGSEVIVERFPDVRVVSTPNVIGDLNAAGPPILSMLQSKLGPNGPKKLIVPDEIAAASKLTVEGEEIEIVEFREGESRHFATLNIPALKSHLASDLVYNEAHCYLAEKRPDAWLDRLNELETFSNGRIHTAYPGHGEPDVPAKLIQKTRDYLTAFQSALGLGDGRAVEQEMLSKFPDYHAKQFLTVFTIPAYFPAK